MLDEKDIQKLLRLKRDEQPGQEYFDRFLHEFHRRQRAEMLRQPAWKVSLERLQTLFGGQGFERLAYSGAVAAVLAVASVVSVNILQQPGGPPAQGSYASVQMSAPAALLNTDIYVSAPAPAPEAAQRPYHMASSRPYYVMDVRPVSYDLPSSF